ncbi:MAG: hypothetical protein Q4B46_02240, partial [Comamonadaceae bacterium]|nr:hypothetical protein [Comamonadaceae bacterium]
PSFVHLSLSVVLLEVYKYLFLSRKLMFLDFSEVFYIFDSPKTLKKDSLICCSLKSRASLGIRERVCLRRDEGNWAKRLQLRRNGWRFLGDHGQSHWIAVEGNRGSQKFCKFSEFANVKARNCGLCV